MINEFLPKPEIVDFDEQKTTTKKYLEKLEKQNEKLRKEISDIRRQAEIYLNFEKETTPLICKIPIHLYTTDPKEIGLAIESASRDLTENILKEVEKNIEITMVERNENKLYPEKTLIAVAHIRKKVKDER